MKRIIEQIKETIGSHYPATEVVALTRIIATELLGVSQTACYLKEPVTLSNAQVHCLTDTIERLAAHEPIQYILGYCDFCGHRFKVNQSTLIPRPETSELVEWIASEKPCGATILDIGTGSGCIAISLALQLPTSDVTAWDISADALEVAAENSKSNDAQVRFKQVDILGYTPKEERFDIIVSNPPYIKENEKEAMHSNVLDWEPHTALFVPDNDPLLFYRTIAQKSLTMLNNGGKLYFEINRAHGTDTVELLSGLGYRDIELRKDIFGNDRMVKATRL